MSHPPSKRPLPRVESLAKLGFAALAVAVLVLSSCASTQVETFTVEFQRPAMGAGGTQTADVVIIRPGMELLTVTTAILNALGQLSFGIEDPEIVPGEAIPERHNVRTDIVPIGQESIRAHNDQSQAMVLPADALYGVRLELSYKIVRSEFYFVTRSVLYMRGSGSPTWREYKGSYDGRFFFAPVRDVLIKRLKDESDARRDP